MSAKTYCMLFIEKQNLATAVNVFGLTKQIGGYTEPVQVDQSKLTTANDLRGGGEYLTANLFEFPVSAIKKE